jgi:CheY-like chemotaxis protein
MSRRILIADDYPRAAETLAWLLRRFDYDIRVATDGVQAIAITEEFQPEFVLLDLDMPKMNGFEAAKHIRNKPWSRGIVLIALSGYWNEKQHELSREAGFDGHLIKPMRVKDIVDLIEKFSRSDC